MVSIAMLAVSADFVQACDYGLQGVGALGALAFVVQLLRGGRWRNPLAGVENTSGGPALIHVLAAGFLYVALAILAISAVRPWFAINEKAASLPGSSGWHLLQAADGAARLLTCVFMAAILWRYRAAAAPDPKRDLWTAIRVGTVGMLIAVPLCTLQLRAATILWEWTHPDAVKPVHVALQALEKSDWGIWGAVQLGITALIIAPLAEELFFRGLILQTAWYYTGHAWLSILLSAALFGWVHVSQPQDVLPLVTLGLVLGYIRLRYRSLAACMVLHALFNARTLIAALLAPELIRA